VSSSPQLASAPGLVAVIGADGSHDHLWLAQAVDRVAASVAGRDHVGVVRRPTGAFVAAVVGCLKAGVPCTVIEPDDAASDVGVDPDELLAHALDAHAPSASAIDPDLTATRFGLGEDDRVAVLSGLPGQVMSAVLGAVPARSTLLLTAPSLTEPRALAAWLRDNGVTVLYATTPVLRAVVAHAASDGRLPALRRVFVENSGQLLLHDVEALRVAAPSCTFVATYRTSPSGRPAAVFAVPEGGLAEPAPLGVPLGTETTDGVVLVLGASGRPAAAGEVGEVCIGAHRTGDLARRWPDGTLEYAGRAGVDRAVDLSETVAALRELPDVRDAVVTERASAEDPPMLVGYVTGPGASLDVAAARRSLTLRLPDALVPKRLVAVAELPLTAAGDYALDALPDPASASAGSQGYVAPRTPIEQELAATLEELLGAGRVGVLDSFFELGGFSLLATQLASRIHEAYDVELSLRDIFDARTVDALAQLVLVRRIERLGIDVEALLDDHAPQPGPE
jgi:acyl carrier protein